MMTQNKKLIGLLFLLGALAALVLLSTSLSNLQLRAGGPIPGGGSSESNAPSFTQLTSSAVDASFLLQGILALFFLIVVIYVSSRLVMLVDIKKIFQWLFILAGLLILIILFSRITPSQPSSIPSDISGITTPPSFDYPISPLGEPPQGLIWAVAIGFAFGMGLLIIRMFKLWPHPKQIKDQLSKEAETAVHAIKIGEDLRSVIIRCYLQMAQTLQEEQGIERSHNMTVREFEDWLGQKEFPPKPVRQLTDLFEKARYDSQPMSKVDETAAVESLNEFVRFCRNGKD